MAKYIAPHNFKNEKGYGLITYRKITAWTTLFTADMVSVTDDDIPFFYSPNTVLTDNNEKFIDINYSGAFNRPLWTYMNTAKSENVNARHVRDENNQLIRLEFFTCKAIEAGSELLLPYSFNN